MPPPDPSIPGGPARPADPPRDAGRQGGVQSVNRALDLLEVVAARGGTATIADIAAAAGVPLPTAHRLLRTLVDRGYMRQAPDRRYALGLGLVPLGAAASAMTGAGTDRLLGSLVDALGETANLAMLEGSTVTYVSQVPGRHSMRMFTEVGRRVEAHCTAVGKAMLATTSDEEARSVLTGAPLTRHTAHTVTDVEELMEQIAEIRSRGYALDQEEQEVGVRCVAVAVPTDAPRLALSVSGPAPRMTDDVIDRAVPMLQRTAVTLATTLAS